MMLMLIGSFFGESNLSGLLKSVGVSNAKIPFWHKISNQMLLDWMILLWRDDFKASYEYLCTKSASTESRWEQTIINDESVFKLWLSERIASESYGRYFSGQVHNVVYGLKISLLGISLNDRFYPIDYQLLKKTDKTDAISIDLLKRLTQWLQKITPIEKKLHLYLSVDSGYHSSKLIESCQELSITLICVPKNNHLIILDTETLSIKAIKEKFVEKETEIATQKQAEKKENQAEKQEEAFFWRVRGRYKSLDMDVTLLVFRLNRSKKVSVIYSPNLSIKAKTLRRRWFVRTHIEQFFRLLKHTLKIQQTKSESVDEFLKKFANTAIKALSWMQLRDWLRKKTKNKNMVYIDICRFIKREIGLQWLRKVEYLGDFSF